MLYTLTHLITTTTRRGRYHCYSHLQMRKWGTKRWSHLAMITQQVSMELGSGPGQPLSCPITFFYTSLFSRRKRTQRSTRQSFYRKKNPRSAQRLSEPMEYEPVTPETETGVGLRSPALTRTKTNGNTWLKHKLQRLSKAGSLSKQTKSWPSPSLLKLIKKETDISRWRHQWKVFRFNF